MAAAHRIDRRRLILRLQHVLDLAADDRGTCEAATMAMERGRRSAERSGMESRRGMWRTFSAVQALPTVGLKETTDETT
jgi:hypothetical protein